MVANYRIEKGWNRIYIIHKEDGYGTCGTCGTCSLDPNFIVDCQLVSKRGLGTYVKFDVLSDREYSNQVETLAFKLETDNQAKKFINDFWTVLKDIRDRK